MPVSFFSLLHSNRKQFLALAISVILLLTGCTWFYPGKEDLAGASLSLLEQPYKIDLSLEGISGETGFFYEGTIQAERETAMHSGIATVSTQGVLFEQSCQSIYDGNSAYQAYGSSWINISRTSPAEAVKLWLTQIGNGRGSYRSEIVPNSEVFSEDIPEDFPQNLFWVRIPLAEFGFSSWCNAYFDSMFSIDTDAFSTVQLDLYFDTSSYTLSLAKFLVEGTQAYLEGTAVITPLDTGIVLPGLTASEIAESEDILSQQWTLANDLTSDLPACITPERTVLDRMYAAYLEEPKPIIHLNGTDLCLPFSITELFELGFALSNSDISIPANSNTALQMISLEGSITVIAGNSSDSPISVSNAMVTGLYMLQEDIGQVQGAFPGGITLESSPDYIAGIWTPISASAGYYRINRNYYAEVYTTSGAVYCIGITKLESLDSAQNTEG